MWVRFAVVSAVLLLMAVIAPDVQAQITEYSGCFKCEEYTTITGAPFDKCKQVPNNSHGDGIECEEREIFMSRFCALRGGACYYTETTGGGDTGGGNGGGTGTGPYDQSGYCPPWYNSCY